GILINIYWPIIPTTYIQPGPPVWPAGGSGSPAPPASTTVTTVRSTTVGSPTTTSSTSTSTAGAARQWAQCGGQGWTGATTCVAPFVCTVLNPFFFQCV
ncbi:hypothetical protein C8R43DRAFT_1110735, partial [Mycena crocata]